MAATRQEISDWFDRALKQGATHLMVVCDTFDWEDYPVYVYQNEDVKERAEHYRKQNSADKLMEVYSMKLDKESQMAEHRAFHYD